MPFTLAHPAAVLPFLRRPFVASALVAGTLAPDLLYFGPVYRFATMEIHGNFTLTLTHQLSSAFWLDPLIAFVMLLVFHLLVKRPLLALAPAPLAGRLPDPQQPVRLLSPIVLGWVVVSTIVGALTHVLWDSFTHYDGYFVERFDLLKQELTAGWDLNRVLQYLSTAVGLLIIAIWLYRWYRRTAPRPVEPGHYVPAWTRYVVAAAVLAFAAAAYWFEVNRGYSEGEAGLRGALTAGVTGFAAALGWYVVIWHAVHLRQLRKARSTGGRDATDGAA